MPSPFLTPDKLLKSRQNYQVKNGGVAGDGFFVDKQYKDNLGPPVSGEKLRFAFFFISLIIFFLAARVFYLQIIKGSKFHSLAEGNRIKTEIVASPRGLIYDRTGRLMVHNLPQFGLLLGSALLKDKKNNQDELVAKISFLTDLSTEEIKAEILSVAVASKDAPDSFFAFDIPYQKAMFFKANEAAYPGFKLQITSERKYDDPLNLSHVLGYLGKINPDEWNELKKDGYQFVDLTGKTGLEKFYEKILRGKPGRTEFEVDAQGRIVKSLNNLASEPGQSLVLTIDYELNKKLAVTLKAQSQNLKRSKAAALALDPRNGEILALVSLPLFNSSFFAEPKNFKAQLNDFFKDKDEPLFNRAISGEYPSGSTIKPLFSAAGLQEKIIDEKTTILSAGGLTIDKWFFPDWLTSGHGLTTVTRALSESINTFFYYLGGGYGDFKGLGLEKMLVYAKKFGFGQALGIDLPGEANGFLPTREWKKKTKGEEWYIGDTYHLAIGQGDILVTPLQIASLTATVANGGTLYQPHLVKEIVNEDKNEKKIIEPKIINYDFVAPENFEIVRRGLRQAVTDGSAKAMSDLPFSSAAKTGTAQVGGDKEPHAWFTVFAPYKNPEIVLTILIENGGEGSTTALPVAKEVLRWYFER